MARSLESEIACDRLSIFFAVAIDDNDDPLRVHTVDVIIACC